MKKKKKEKGKVLLKKKLSLPKKNAQDFLFIYFFCIQVEGFVIKSKMKKKIYWISSKRLRRKALVLKEQK